MHGTEDQGIPHSRGMSTAMRLLPVLLCCGLLTAHGQSYRSLVATADSLYDAKAFKQSIRMYEQAFKIERKNPTDLYNAACSAALALEKERAYDLLESAVENGWINVHHIKEDTDLTSLHGEKRWEALLARMEQRLEEIESHYNKPLQKELLEIRDATTGQPVENVNVFLASTSFGIGSNKDGSFRLANIPAGHYQIVFSRVGYGSEAYALEIERAEPREFDVKLTARVISRR